MRRFSQRQALQTLSEINVTPLLDLAFVLLIIFIITTPLMENSMDIIIPSSVAAQNAVDPTAVQTVSIDRFKVIKLNEVPVPLEDLRARLAELKEQRPDLAVVIRPHKELPVQRLVDIMDVMQKAQISKIGVVTSMEE